MIAMQVSLYPMVQKDINPALNIFWKALEEKNINHRVTPLSTIAWDEDEDKLYDSIFQAYKKARQSGPAVMVTTLTIGDSSQINELLEFL